MELSNTTALCPIKVYCRFHPVTDDGTCMAEGKEEVKAALNSQMSHLHLFEITSNTSVTVVSSNESFEFDRVFPLNVSQEEVYNEAAKGLIDDVVLNGCNGTIFAYGQTGSGKTYTIQGPIDNGIIPRMANQVFNTIKDKDKEVKYTITVSMFTIYMEKLQDLFELNSNNLKLKESNNQGNNEIYIQNLSEIEVKDKDEMMILIRKGYTNRLIEKTKMGQCSSRDSTLLIVKIEQESITQSVIKRGVLTLVDLAGSEIPTTSQSITSNMPYLSIKPLQSVINKLNKQSPFVPYRDSKLTYYLKQSLGGNAKTVFIITCSSKEKYVEETLSTLKFGQQAKKVMNKPIMNTMSK